MPRTAQCLCGAFSVIVSAEPMVVNVCHCQDCQRRSGAPWSSNAYFSKETVSLNDSNKIYTRTSDAGTRINHHFCPICGVTVCWTLEAGSARFGIPVGAFNDPSFPAPSVSVWEKKTIRVVAYHGKYESLGHAAACSLRAPPPRPRQSSPRECRKAADPRQPPGCTSDQSAALPSEGEGHMFESYRAGPKPPKGSLTPQMLAGSPGW
jgi:hypothetical protein